jgi:hypothetical protein
LRLPTTARLAARSVSTTAMARWICTLPVPKPTIIKKEAKFEYDSTKGFVTSPISTVEGNSLELLGDAKATYLDDSKEIYKSKLYSWYYNEESQDYKLLIYDIDNASKKIETFNFENSRIPKIVNKSYQNSTISP